MVERNPPFKEEETLTAQEVGERLKKNSVDAYLFYDSLIEHSSSAPFQVCLIHSSYVPPLTWVLPTTRTRKTFAGINMPRLRHLTFFSRYTLLTHLGK